MTSPAIARPMMNIDELAASPQMADPISKILMVERRIDFRESKGLGRQDVDDRA